MIERDKRNNPVMLMGPLVLSVKRVDNELVTSDVVADVEDADGRQVIVGYDKSNSAKMTVSVIDTDNSKRFYSLNLTALVEEVVNQHRVWKDIPHLRPVTTADAELAAEAEAQAELEREPTEQELADATAEVPPSLNEAES